MTTTTKANAGCLDLESNLCTRNSDCCSGYCDNMNGAWANGFCKEPINQSGNTGCLDVWAYCSKNSDCCSNFCDDQNGHWAVGSCKNR
jgi:hypothetical protein